MNEGEYKNLKNKYDINRLLEEYSNRFNFHKSSIIFIWPARLHEETKWILNFLKPVKDLILAANITILVAGDGPDKQMIEEWVDESRPNFKGQSLMRMLGGNTFGHYYEHMIDLRAYRQNNL